MKSPRSQWSPAYRRRIERAEARGAITRQQARGHHTKEHITRKENKKHTPKVNYLIKTARERERRRSADTSPSLPLNLDLFIDLWEYREAFADVWVEAAKMGDVNIRAWRRRKIKIGGDGYIKLIARFLNYSVPEFWFWYH